MCVVAAVDPCVALSTNPRTLAAANEVFLWHGCNHEYVEGMADGGMESRHCSLDGMFGAALYFAENSSKSNQYVHSGSCKLSGAMPRDPHARQQWDRDCTCKCADECCMLLCRVTLGDALLEVQHRGNAPGQFWHQRRTESEKPGGTDGEIYNSVIAESSLRNQRASVLFREYIVYVGAQIYPEYLVYYKRRA